MEYMFHLCVCVCVFLVHFLKENWNTYYCNEQQTIKECLCIRKIGTVNNPSQPALLQRLARILKICDVRIALIVLNGPRHKKTCLRGLANNTGTHQPAHTRSLISAFVVRFIESIISKLASGEISS